MSISTTMTTRTRASAVEIPLIQDTLFQYLSSAQLSQCALVSRDWHAACTPSLWRTISLERKVHRKRFLRPEALAGLRKYGGHVRELSIAFPEVLKVLWELHYPTSTVIGEGEQDTAGASVDGAGVEGIDITRTAAVVLMPNLQVLKSRVNKEKELVSANKHLDYYFWLVHLSPRLKVLQLEYFCWEQAERYFPIVGGHPMVEELHLWCLAGYVAGSSLRTLLRYARRLRCLEVRARVWDCDKENSAIWTEKFEEVLRSQGSCGGGGEDPGSESALVSTTTRSAATTIQDKAPLFPWLQELIFDSSIYYCSATPMLALLRQMPRLERLQFPSLQPRVYGDQGLPLTLPMSLTRLQHLDLSRLVLTSPTCHQDILRACAPGLRTLITGKLNQEGEGMVKVLLEYHGSTLEHFRVVGGGIMDGGAEVGIEGECALQQILSRCPRLITLECMNPSQANLLASNPVWRLRLDKESVENGGTLGWVCKGLKTLQIWYELQSRESISSPRYSPSDLVDASSREYPQEDAGTIFFPAMLLNQLIELKELKDLRFGLHNASGILRGNMESIHARDHTSSTEQKKADQDPRMVMTDGMSRVLRRLLSLMETCGGDVGDGMEQTGREMIGGGLVHLKRLELRGMKPMVDQVVVRELLKKRRQCGRALEWIEYN